MLPAIELLIVEDRVFKKYLMVEHCWWLAFYDLLDLLDFVLFLLRICDGIWFVCMP